jgi:hypothetical protein
LDYGAVSDEEAKVGFEDFDSGVEGLGEAGFGGCFGGGEDRG